MVCCVRMTALPLIVHKTYAFNFAYRKAIPRYNFLKESLCEKNIIATCNWSILSNHLTLEDQTAQFSLFFLSYSHSIVFYKI